MIIKENLKYYRKKAGLNQRKLAEVSGVSYSSITKFESGDRTSATQSAIAAIAIVLRVRICDIYDERDYILGSPFNFLDAEAKEHLTAQGYSHKSWYPSEVDTHSIVPRNMQALMDIMNIDADGCEEGMVVKQSVLQEVIAETVDGKEQAFTQPAYKKIFIGNAAMKDFYNSVLNYMGYEYDKMIKTGKTIK